MIDAPNWIDSEIWLAFVEMRAAKGKRAPFTDRAAKMIIHELDRLRGQGHNPDEVLRQSVMAGWSGVFGLKHLDTSYGKHSATGVPRQQLPPNPGVGATRRYLDAEASRPVSSQSEEIRAKLAQARLSVMRKAI